jgi:hypothetical protein
MSDAVEYRLALHQRAAELQRSVQERQETTAAIHEAHGRRVLEAADAGSLAYAIGSVVGESSLALHFVSTFGTTATAVTADQRSRSCHDLEVVFGEGPGTDAIGTGLLVTEHAEVAARWPNFGPAAAALDVRSVAAAPIAADGWCLGALTVYSDSQTKAREATRKLPAAAAAVTSLLLDVGLGSILGSDQFAVVHQACGMVSSRLGCPVDDAMALLRARAFVDDTSLADLSARVVDRSLVLD